MNSSSDAVEEKVESARIFLESIGMDAERSNERSALVLLALANIKASSNWAQATNPMLGTLAIMNFIRDEYGKEYKPNTRETIRRQTLHQFLEAGLVSQNPDLPSRPVNSPKNNYQLTQLAVELLRDFESYQWEVSLTSYLEQLPGLKHLYAAERETFLVPATLPGGAIHKLSPGGQNLLMKSMIEVFCPSFTPGGVILYIGDAGNKWSFFGQENLEKLGVTVDEHGKMPDLVVYMPDRNWLVLLEAASSHGPVDAKRVNELSSLFRESTAGLVYVSCFPDRATFRKYVDKIAWETEVWCADHPTHMIHYNGDRFLGPR